MIELYIPGLNFKACLFCIIIEEEAMSLSAFNFVLQLRFSVLLSWFQPNSLCCLSPFLLSYVTVSIGHFWVPPGFCIKTRLGAQPFIWKWFFILMQIKLISTRKVEHLTSFWYRGPGELGNGLLRPCMSLVRILPEHGPMIICIINNKWNICLQLHEFSVQFWALHYICFFL